MIVAVVAASRVILGVHYPGDVVAGMLLGGGWAVVRVTVPDAMTVWARVDELDRRLMARAIRRAHPPGSPRS